MFYELLSVFFGTIKILIYKLIYFKRITFESLPKMNSSFKIAIKRNSKLELAKKFRCRNNISFRIYDGGKVKIGNDCFLNDGCSINCQKNIEIGNNVIFGQNVMIFDHDHDYKHDMNKFVKKPVKIGNNVWIGANVTILKGVTIGDNVVIAAGTIVNKNIDNNCIYYNNINAKIINNKKLH